MNVPEKIELRLSSQTSKDLSGVIATMKVKAGRKNPYYIYFPKTDKNGNAEITREDFVGQFKDYWEMALMDYDGNPEVADPNVEVSLFDTSWLKENRTLAMAWPLFRHEQQKWHSRKEQYEYMTNNRNHEFEFAPITVSLHETTRIVLKVK